MDTLCTNKGARAVDFDELDRQKTPKSGIAHSTLVQFTEGLCSGFIQHGPFEQHYTVSADGSRLLASLAYAQSTDRVILIQNAHGPRSGITISVGIWYRSEIVIPPAAPSTTRRKTAGLWEGLAQDLPALVSWPLRDVYPSADESPVQELAGQGVLWLLRTRGVLTPTQHTTAAELWAVPQRRSLWSLYKAAAAGVRRGPVEGVVDGLRNLWAALCALFPSALAGGHGGFLIEVLGGRDPVLGTSITELEDYYLDTARGIRPTGWCE